VYEELHGHHDMAKLQAQINPVTGPVYVEGARPGDALAVTVHEIRLKDYGWSVSLPGSGALQHVMGDDMFTRRVPIDADGVHVTSRHTFPALPMIGCMGTAPATGANSTIMPAYAEGGNMDVTENRVGSTVYLPVQVEGAYLSIGDIHAIMAEGESSFVAIEAEGVAVVSIDVVPGLALRAPRIETDDEWIFVGLGAPVQESVRRGYEDAFAFLVDDHGWTKGDAFAVLSAVGHSRLGGPTGSEGPDPLHPFDAVGAVTLHRVPKAVL
jgi:amidase